jgi:hypothetical protein
VGGDTLYIGGHTASVVLTTLTNSLGSTPLEATTSWPYTRTSSHQDVVALGDRPEDPLAHVLVPDRDGKREETLPRFRNGESELGELR